MKGDRLFGMVQPKFKTNLKPEVYNVGCLGKITSFSETIDKRFIINLSGIMRFKIEEELKTDKLYRKFKVNYSDFIEDVGLKKNGKKIIKSHNLINKIKLFLKKKNYTTDFKELEQLDYNQLINTICMISPFSIEEKQKLVETVQIENKAKTLEEIISLNLVGGFENKTLQ